MLARIDSSKRMVVLAALMTVVAVFVSAWSYGHMSDCRGAAVAAADDLAVCHRIADQVRRLRHRPSVAGSHEPRQHELTRRIEKSAQQAQISTPNLDKVWPAPARYIADTPYKKHATQIVLRDVTLQQVVTLIHTLESEGNGPRLTRIRLVVPRDKTASNRWTAEATLTYLVYAPRIKSTSLR